MKHVTTLFALTASTMLLTACGNSDYGAESASTPAGTHTHADGTTHAAHGTPEPEATPDQGHAHDEVPLGTAKIGGLNVELAQAHGAVVAGKEGHLIVKLPYSDKGATVVRAWIGTNDRTLSYVGKGDYAASHDDYDIHADAPDPLPANAMWWIEITKPDGTKVVGSAKPMLN